MEYGLSDPASITWAATFSINQLGTRTNERIGLVLQTVESGVQVYITRNEGTGWVVGAPVVVAEY